MNPSRYALPQHVSEDRRRARAETLRLEREKLQFAPDAAPDGIPEGYRWLPPACADLPKELDFPPSKFYGQLVTQNIWTMINLVPGTVQWFWLANKPARFPAIFQGILGPRDVMSRWRDDAEFARQRLTGVNPMKIRLLRKEELSPEWTPLREAAAAVLQQRHPRRPFDEMLQEHRLFYVEYPDLWHEQVQGQVRPGARLAAPTCLFWQDDINHLMPLAIQLKPRHVRERNPVFTPLHPTYDWLVARTHVQAADTCVHQGTYHLLETHLVSGVVALAMFRQLHPDHPVRQMLEPHYHDTLAINKLAETALLAKGGVIDTALAARVPGTLNAARRYYSRWDFEKRSLKADLEERGLLERGRLPSYYYRDDALEVHAAIDNYVNGLLSLWYKTDEDVTGDCELQAWVREAASPRGGDIPGFPDRLSTVAELQTLCAHLLFRAGPQHAAVNNGQFESYGWVPNSPALTYAPLPEETSPRDGLFSEEDFWRFMPKRSPTTAQLNSVWLLSAPTTRTLLHSGESPAFHPSLCPQAEEVVGGFRRRLHTLSQSIQRRNETLDIPYRFLDPANISRSTDI